MPIFRQRLKKRNVGENACCINPEFMKKNSYLLMSLLFGFFAIYFSSCNQQENQGNPSKETSSYKTSKDSSVAKTEFGERFSIVGDFNGDKIVDTVYESYISGITNQETNKIWDNQDWENNITRIINNRPVTRLYSSIRAIDTFTVTKEAQQIGLFHFRNLGDINNDGKDEIGYAIKWADNSNLNKYHIIGLHNNSFKELFSFEINETLLYDNQEGLFDNGELIKQKDEKIILYKFLTDSATIETGEHTFD
jgi:hypothetical protein